jgi:UDP-N-acetylglucosamine 2-epimerase
VENKKTKVLCVIGTRPELIKMAPVIYELKRRNSFFECIVCLTGQHKEMVEGLLEIFKISPDYNLKVMKGDQTLAGLTSALFDKLDSVFNEVKPDWVLAQGDTTTVFVSSTLAYYHKVRFAHVEAGLRTGNKQHPFPEEINRIFADHAADLLFAPTITSQANLLREGLPQNKILVTGNTVVDALHMSLAIPYDWESGPLSKIDRRKSLVLVTTHRRESFGKPMREVLESLRELAGEYPAVQFVFPVHLNPNVQKPVLDVLKDVANISLLAPLDYLSLINVIKEAFLILTDSGGIQEEGASLGVPVLVMRETTERPEGVVAGLVELVGTDRNLLLARARKHLNRATKKTSHIAESPYGDGHAAKKIVDSLISASCSFE